MKTEQGGGSRCLRRGVWAAVLVMAMWPGAGSGRSRGAMEIGLGAAWLWPQWDVAELTPDWGYEVGFQYWLNATTAVVINYYQLRFEGPLTVDGEEESLSFSTGVLTGGARYRFKTDLWIKPYLEAGIGYQNWTATYSIKYLDPRSGSTICYYVGAGVEYEWRHTFTVALDLQYLFMPMRENLETEVLTLGPGNHKVTKGPLNEAAYLGAGVEFSWRFK